MICSLDWHLCNKEENDYEVFEVDISHHTRAYHVGYKIDYSGAGIPSVYFDIAAQYSGFVAWDDSRIGILGGFADKRRLDIAHILSH